MSGSQSMHVRFPSTLPSPPKEGRPRRVVYPKLAQAKGVSDRCAFTDLFWGPKPLSAVAADATPIDEVRTPHLAVMGQSNQDNRSMSSYFPEFHSSS
ncbi:hypothetical protein GLOTRDRAFT_113046 [Gloeophyllum trabeum ATCC 11539]|uniref:Uncharacterized protein n=1 Tax=Gloeophyllum trabeum (strain ATCC 11539 / FP-39264 / Madison 617) TaxID=670483 RepID=S7QLS9_GLOTA|nr:uncharacterized protein GLOTRDRAFT_113046 [Gloeophyllum trabeum ATCC 11539]EPQ60392.1 hypothetical protein GLOTRDRAFT_113046 [Gloeophyllum trabeum ATCC 11539]